MASGRGLNLRQILLLILVIQPLVAVVELDCPAANPSGGDLRWRVERVTVGDEQRRILADFELVDAIADAENLSWIERDGFERLISGQAEADGRRGVVGQIAD